VRRTTYLGGRKSKISFTCLLIAFFIITVFLKILWCPEKDHKYEGNSSIMEEPKITDEAPKSFAGYNQWWAMYGYACTTDKSNELLININGKTGGLLYGSAFTLNGKVLVLDWQGNWNWNETTNTAYGNLKRRSDGKNGLWTLKFHGDGYRVWTHELESESLTIEMWSRGVPLWGARTQNEMIPFAYGEDGTPIYAGGFQDAITIRATLMQANQTLIFNGFGEFEHIWLMPQRQAGGQEGDYMYFLIINSQEEFYIDLLLAHARNSRNSSEVFVRTGRIGFPKLDQYYAFDDYVYYGSGDYRPNLFYLKGTFEKGKVDLEGERIGWLYYEQNHPYILWKGTITIDGEIINVNSLGASELQGVVRPPRARILDWFCSSVTVVAAFVLIVALATVVLVAIVKSRRK